MTYDRIPASASKPTYRHDTEYQNKKGLADVRWILVRCRVQVDNMDYMTTQRYKGK